jgi:hypothetical protein
VFAKQRSKWKIENSAHALSLFPLLHNQAIHFTPSLFSLLPKVLLYFRAISTRRKASNAFELLEL